LLAAEIKLSELDKFEPFRDAVAFYNPPVTVKMNKDVPQSILKDETFGPFKKDRDHELPEYAAMFLICKGYAETEA